MRFLFLCFNFLNLESFRQFALKFIIFGIYVFCCKFLSKSYTLIKKFFFQNLIKISRFILKILYFKNFCIKIDHFWKYSYFEQFCLSNSQKLREYCHYVWNLCCKIFIVLEKWNCNLNYYLLFNIFTFYKIKFYNNFLYIPQKLDKDFGLKIN